MLSKKIQSKLDFLILDLHARGFLVFEINQILKADIDYIFKKIDDSIHISNCESDYLPQNNPAKY